MRCCNFSLLQFLNREAELSVVTKFEEENIDAQNEERFHRGKTRESIDTNTLNYHSVPLK